MTPYIDYYLPSNFTDGFTFADGRIKMRSIIEAVIAFIPILAVLFLVKPSPNIMFGVITFSASILFFICTMGIDGSTPSVFLMRYINYRRTKNISLYNPVANKKRSEDWMFDNTEEGGIKGIQKRAQEIVQSSGITEDAVSIVSADEILRGQKFYFKDEVEDKKKPKGRNGNKATDGKGKKQVPGKPPTPPKMSARHKPKPPTPSGGNLPPHPQTLKKSKDVPGTDTATVFVGEARQGTHALEHTTPLTLQSVDTVKGAVPITRVLPTIPHITFINSLGAASVPLQEAPNDKGGTPIPANKAPTQRRTGGNPGKISNRSALPPILKHEKDNEDEQNGGSDDLEFVFD